MESQLTQRQLQLIHYITRRYSLIQKQPLLIFIQSLSILQLIGPVLVNAGGPTLLMSISFFYLLIMLSYVVSLSGSNGDFLGRYFQRHYGEVKLVSKQRSKYIQYLILMAGAVVGIIVIEAFSYVSISLRLNSPAIFATLLILINFLVWLRKPARQIQFYYPLIRLPLILFFWLPIFSPQFDDAHTIEFSLFNLMIVMGFTSLALTLPLAFDILLLNKFFKGVPQSQPEPVVLEPNGDIPPMVLQTILAVLAICENVDNRYLQRLTGLTRTNITLILVQLQNASFVYIQEQEIKKGGTRLIVSLTSTGTEAAHMATTNLALAAF